MGTGEAMRLGAVLLVLAALALAACGVGPEGSRPEGSRIERKCPVPVHYSKEQYDQIQKALKDLPKDSILLQTMQDYEQERDDLKFCK